MADQKPLLDRARAGEADALEEMVRSELPRVYNLCLRLCRRPADAEDLCQDVFVRAVRAVRHFKGESSLSTWLHRIAVNTWKNRVRYEKRRFFSKHVSVHAAEDDEENGPFAPDPADPAPGPAASAEVSDEHRRLLTAMEELEPDDRAVVVLRDIEDRPYEEIAAILEMNLGTVKSRLSRAREKLRELFRRLGGRA